MHIVLGILGAVVTILILLNRLTEAGIDLGGLNPYLWQRRRKWRKKYQGNPMFKLEEPMELTALLMVGLAKIEGDMSKEQKRTIQKLYEKEFKLSKREATDLLMSCVHLFGKGDEVKNEIVKIMQPCVKMFSEEQSMSALKLLETITQLDGESSDLQNNLLNTVKSEFDKNKVQTTKWSQ